MMWPEAEDTYSRWRMLSTARPHSWAPLGTETQRGSTGIPGRRRPTQPTGAAAWVK